MSNEEDYFDSVYKFLFSYYGGDNCQIEVTKACEIWTNLMKIKEFKHFEVWIDLIKEKHASGELKAITQETWTQYLRMVTRAKEGDLTKIKTNSGLWNQIICDFVTKANQ